MTLILVPVCDPLKIWTARIPGFFKEFNRRHRRHRRHLKARCRNLLIPGLRGVRRN